MSKEAELKILMIDDHYLILEGYKNVLSKLDGRPKNLKIDTAESCDSGWYQVNSKNYDIIILDINFPISEANKIMSGEDLGLKIKEQYPQIDIIILTTLEDPLRLNNILLNINPSGFLLKGDTTPEELIRCVETVISNPPYYGSKISKLLRNEASNKYVIDETDRLILHQLSLGTKTKDLTKYVNLSLRAVENRKKKLKIIFGVSDRGNKSLLDRARESGYI